MLNIIWEKGMTVYVIVGAIALVLGGVSGWQINKATSKNAAAAAEGRAREAEAQARQAEAAAAATAASADLVKEAVSSYLAQSELTAEVTSSARARWVCEGEYRNEEACIAYLMCSQVAGSTVQTTACDAAMNSLLSVRKIEVIEAPPVDGGADASLRKERDIIYGARK